MLLRSSRLLALRASLVVAAVLAFEPVAAAQATGAASGTGAAAGTTAPKKQDPKKADPKGTAPATAAPAPGAPADEKAPAEPAEASAEKAEKEDRRAIYLSVDLGFTRPDVGAISDNTGFDKTAANGLLGGFGIGYRFKDLRLGGRFRTASTADFSLWSVMGELGYGLPFRPVSPVLFVHAGYMFDSGVDRSVIAQSLPAGNVLTPNVDLSGAVVGGEIVASYWVTKFLRVGPFLGVDVTFLHRSQVGLPQSIVPITQETRSNALFGDSGSGEGYTLSIGVRGTGDIGF